MVYNPAAIKGGKGTEDISSGLYWETSHPEAIINTLNLNGVKTYTVRWADGSLHRVTASGPTAKAEQAWTQTYEPMWNEYSTNMNRELQTAYDRSLAEAQGRLGYGLSMSGSGEGGLAEASRLALTTEAQNKRMDLAAQRETMMNQAHIQFMTTKDAQAFEMAKLWATQQYNKQMAEMNQPSWWESTAQILATAAAIFFAPETGGLSLGALPATTGWYGGSTG